MGLDIVCDCGEIGFRAGSYSGFGDWRELLARSMGIILGEMWGFGGDTMWHLDIEFVELFDHSDCDGELSHEECTRLKDDFDTMRHPFVEAVSALCTGVDAEYYIEKYDLWREAVRHCADISCKLVFC